ncbi:MAG: glycoside-pentoside-hexuronide (GPH):cation symporter [Bacillota bacterium]
MTNKDMTADGMVTMGANCLKKIDYILFCASTLFVGFMNGMVTLYLLVFYTSVLGISTTAAGVMFLIAKIFDGINDPIMGVIVDKTRTKYGKMKPYLMFGAIPFGIVVMCMFLPITTASMTSKIVFMYVSYLLYDFASTIVCIPLLGLPTVVSHNPKERNTLITSTYMFQQIGEQGSLVIVSLMLVLTKNNLSISYFSSAAIVGVLAPIVMLITCRRIKEVVEPPKESIKFINGIKYFFKNKDLFWLVITIFLSFFRTLTTVVVAYYALYVMEDASMQIWFSAPLGISSMLGMLLVPKLQKKFSPKTIIVIGTFWYSLGLLIIWLLHIETWYILAISMFFIMAATGLLNVTPNLMAADTIDDWDLRHGERYEGVTFSLLSMRNKLTSGMTSYMIGLLLSYYLFISPNTNIDSQVSHQFAVTTDGIYNIMFLIPAITNLLVLIPLSQYKLSGDRLKQLHLDVANKHSKNDSEVA